MRAMSQRKRAMKGCLAIWLVWCCYAAYERTIDGIVGMFIPFYSEIKAAIVLFFLLTRAKGAEPVYLHILRPLVKPYAATLDSVLEFITQVGDLLFLLCAVPFHLISSMFDTVWNRWILRKRAAPQEPAEPASPVEEEEKQQKGPTEHGETRTRRRALHNAHIKAAAEPPSPEVSIYATPKAAPEISQPSASAYQDSPPRPTVGLPTPPAEDRVKKPKYVDEWRQYEAFPSAWPASPPSNVSGLPSDSIPSLDDVLAGAAKESQQGFRRSLQLSRESLNPDSDDNLSDDREARTGVHIDDDMEIDEQYEDDEDDFNVTLRTPYPLSRIMNVSGMTATIDDDSYDESTGISTTDYDSPLRTRTNSDASAPSLDGSPSTAKKRRLPSPARLNKVARPVMRERSGTQDTIRAKAAPTRPSVRAPLVTRKQSSKGESSANEGVGAEEADDTSVVKKRLVETKPKSNTAALRPVTTKVGENKVPPRKIPAATGPRGPVRTAATVKPAPKLTVTNSKDSAKRRLAEKTTGEVVADMADPFVV